MFLKTEKIARTHKNISFCNTILFSFAKPQEHTDREMTGNKPLLSHRKGKSLRDILITAKFSGQRFKSASEWQEWHRPINTF